MWFLVGHAVELVGVRRSEEVVRGEPPGIIIWALLCKEEVWTTTSSLLLLRNAIALINKLAINLLLPTISIDLLPISSIATWTTLIHRAVSRFYLHIIIALNWFALIVLTSPESCQQTCEFGVCTPIIVAASWCAAAVWSSGNWRFTFILQEEAFGAVAFYLVHGALGVVGKAVRLSKVARVGRGGWGFRHRGENVVHRGLGVFEGVTHIVALVLEHWDKILNLDCILRRSLSSTNWILLLIPTWKSSSAVTTFSMFSSASWIPLHWFSLLCRWSPYLHQTTIMVVILCLNRGRLSDRELLRLVSLIVFLCEVWWWTAIHYMLFYRTTM